LEVVVRSPDPSIATLSAAVVGGQCSDLSASSPPTIAQLPPATAGGFWRWQLLQLQDAKLGDHAAVVLARGLDSAPVGCISLPVDQARALKPLGAARTSSFRPAAHWQVAGQVKLWTTSSGDYLLRAEATGPAYDLSGGRGTGGQLLWHVVEGDCRAWLDASQKSGNPSGLSVLNKFNYPVDTPNSQSFSLVIPAEAVGHTLALAAFVQGGGPLVTCATLPPIS
jgi:hypothetical protein